jgi:hypothetical protein
MRKHWTPQEVRGRLENILFRVEAIIHNLNNAIDPQEQAIDVGDLEDVRTGILDLLARRPSPPRTAIMSCVTSVVILSSEMLSAKIFTAINAWLREHGHGPLADLSGASASEKSFEADLWMGAFNCLDEAAFLALLPELPWDPDSRARVLMREERDRGFRERWLLNGPLD